MPQTIEVPGYGDVEFPDGMSDEQIASAIQRNMPQKQPQRFGSGKSFDVNAEGGLTPTAEMVNTPSRGLGDFGEWLHAGRRVGESGLKLATSIPAYVAGNFAGAGALGYDVAANAVMHPLSGSTPGSYANPTAVRDKVTQALTYQPSEDGISSQMADVPGQVLRWSGKQLARPVKGIPYLETIAENVPEAGANALGLRAGATPKAPKLEKPIPTTEALKQSAGEAYKRSEDIGAVVNEGRFSNFQNELNQTLQKSGIDPTLHPDSTAALKRVMAEKGPMTLEKIETLRRIAQDAEGSIKPADARKAGDMVDAIDEMVDNLKPEDLSAGTPEAATALREARDYWKRARKAETLDELMRRAELSAPNFSASGMENAIRTEFRALAKNQRRFKRFSKEEQDAIARVAKGGPVENTLRMIGKAAPTGVVSTGLGTGLGFLLGGPAGAAAVPALGGAARLGARAMTTRNALRANELVRRPSLQSPIEQTLPVLGRKEVAAPQASAASIRAEIANLIQNTGAQAGRPDAKSMREVWVELARLQANLASAEAREAAQRGGGLLGQ